MMSLAMRLPLMTRHQTAWARNFMDARYACASAHFSDVDSDDALSISCWVRRTARGWSVTASAIVEVDIVSEIETDVAFSGWRLQYQPGTQFMRFTGSANTNPIPLDLRTVV